MTCLSGSLALVSNEERLTVNQTLHSQQTPRGSPMRASHGVSVVSLLENLTHNIIKPHHINHSFSLPVCWTPGSSWSSPASPWCWRWPVRWVWLVVVWANQTGYTSQSAYVSITGPTGKEKIITVREKNYTLQSNLSNGQKHTNYQYQRTLMNEWIFHRNSHICT